MNELIEKIKLNKSKILSSLVLLTAFSAALTTFFNHLESKENGTTEK